VKVVSDEKKKGEKMEERNLISVVKEAIDKCDPIGLLNTGAPEDEYDPEIEEIAEKVANCRNVEEIQNLIYETFVKWFDQDIVGESEKYKEPAENIAKYILKLKEEK